jgi:hypothetical protein
MYLPDRARLTLVLLAIGWLVVAGFAGLRSVSFVGLWEGDPQLRWLAAGAVATAVLHLTVAYARGRWVHWVSTALALAGVALGVALLFVVWPLGIACGLSYSAVLVQKLTDRPDAAAVEHLRTGLPRRVESRPVPSRHPARPPLVPEQSRPVRPGESVLNRLLRWLFVHPGRTRPGRGELETHRNASVLGQDTRRWRRLEERKRQARDARRRRD